jgi:hypothetical protein
MSVNAYETLNAKVGRRSFLKMAAITSAFGVTSSLASTGATRTATEEEIKIHSLVQKKLKQYVQHALLDVELSLKYKMVFG